MRALSIRQPYAEQILRGTKKIEYRSRPTSVRERVYIYASLTPAEEGEFYSMGLVPGDLPTGVLVGTVEVVGCTGKTGDYHWHLKRPDDSVERFDPGSTRSPFGSTPFENRGRLNSESPKQGDL